MVSAFESGRRLCLLFEAGGCRYAVEATAVTEVAEPDPDGRSLRGALELKDLSRLLGGDDEVRPGMAVVLDVSPTLGVRIAKVHEVVDVARDRHFGIPPVLAESLAFVSRGVLLHGERLYLELEPEAIPRQPVAAPASRPRGVFLLETPPERALVFESQGVLFGLPLALVSQVVPASAAFLALPTSHGAVAGLFPHDQVLWPVVSAPALIGGRAAAEALFVLSELAGAATGLSAARVLGVHGGFVPTEGRGEFTTPAVNRPVLFLDLQHMFS